MPTASTIIETAFARKYLQQLCKHFAHKIAVHYTPDEGRVQFPPGRCLMSADDTTLSFHCHADDQRGIPVMQSILDKHLVKFAWREDLDYQWGAPTPEDLATMLAADDFLSDLREGAAAP